MNDVKYDVNDMPKPGLLVGLSFQHLFAMFGATVLVPILVGIDPAIALFSSGLGTLAHLTVTKYKIPAYMGSSFAYIAGYADVDEDRWNRSSCPRCHGGWFGLLVCSSDC